MSQIKHWSRSMPDSNAQRVDFNDYLQIIKRRKWIIIISFLFILSTVATVSFLLTPIYEGTTQIIIDTKSASPLNFAEFMPDDIGAPDFFQTQYNLLRSRSLAYMVINGLDLQQDFILSTAGNKHPINELSSANDSSGIKRYTKGSKPAVVQEGLQQEAPIADWYLSNLEITPVRGSRLVQVSFFNPKAETAARVANAHAHAFIEKSIETQHVAAQKALEWLQTQLEEQKDKVEASQQKIYEYKKAHDNVSLEERQNIVSQKLMKLSATLTETKSKRLAREIVYNQLRDFSVGQESLFALPEIAQDPIIQTLRKELVQFKTKRLEMATNYGPKHPKMLKLNSAIEQLNQEIDSEVQRLAKTIEAELNRTETFENSIQQALDAQKQAALALNKKAINYDVLRREAESSQQFYELLLKQVREISLTSAVESSNVSIVDQAEVPRFPVKPKILLNLLIAAILGLFIGTGLALFIEYADNTVKTPDDVLKGLGMRVLGQIPYDKAMKTTKLPILTDDGSAGDRQGIPPTYQLYDISSRVYNSLEVTWHGSATGQTFLIESATMNEGKTTVLGNFAVSLARAGLRVVMVDGDVQRPALHQLFGIQNSGGLTDSVRQVLAQDISNGSLSEYSGDDLFFLAGLKRLSGQFTISNHSQTMVAAFVNGRLLHLQNQNNPEPNRLGQMLLRGDFLSESQLEDAVDRNRRTGLPLGYILINSGYITIEQLQGPLRLQVEENLHKLFSWRSGTFTFEPANGAARETERVNFGEDYSSLIHPSGRVSGSSFVEKEILSRLKPVSQPNLFIINAGRDNAPLGGPVNIAVLERFLSTLKQHFDVVLIDAPPLLNSADGSAFSPLADGVILVVKSGHLSLKKLQEAKNCLNEAKANIVGAVLNQVKVDRDYYYR